MLPTNPRALARSICSSSTTPCSSIATRVSCGVTLIRISCGIGGGRVQDRIYAAPAAPRFQSEVFSKDREAEARERLRGLVQRQPHDARVAAVDPAHER